MVQIIIRRLIAGGMLNLYIINKETLSDILSLFIAANLCDESRELYIRGE